MGEQSILKQIEKINLKLLINYKKLVSEYKKNSDLTKEEKKDFNDRNKKINGLIKQNKIFIDNKNKRIERENKKKEEEKRRVKEQEENKIKIKEQEFLNGSLKYLRFENVRMVIKPSEILNLLKPEIYEYISEEMEKHNNITIRITFITVFERKIVEDQGYGEQTIRYEEELISFSLVNNYNLLTIKNYTYTFKKMGAELDTELEKRHNEGSYFYYKYTEQIILSTVKYVARKGREFIELPKEIENKKATCNIKNSDSNCFFYCIAAYRRKQIIKKIKEMEEQGKKHNFGPQNKNLNDSNIYKPEELKFNIEGFQIENGMKIEQIKKFNKKNNISINVFDYKLQNKKLDIYPIYIEDKIKSEEQIDLLYVENEQTKKNHYVLITDLSRLLNEGVKNKLYYCRRCLQGYRKEEDLNEHEKIGYCETNDAAKIVMPKNNIFKFENHKAINKIYFIAYYDFECNLEKTDIKKGESTTIYENHKVAGYFINLSCQNKKYNRVYQYSGENAISKFYNDICEIKQYAEEILNKLEKEDQPDFIPFVGHNAKNYDNMLILKNISELLNSENLELSAIPLTTEKFLSFSIKEKFTLTERKNLEYKKLDLRFIDSCQHLSYSLEKLANYLTKEEKIETMEYFKNKGYNDEQINELLKKGIFPYSWFDSLEKLKHTEILTKKDFYDTLNKKEATDKEYNQYLKVYKLFDCKSFYDYYMLYLSVDVFLLTDVFNNYRNKSYEKFELDPAYYYSTPGFTLDSCLKFTNVEIELLTDYDMFLMFEKSLRGGVSMVASLRYAKANNKYMGGDYDETKENFYIQYYDCNSLYPTQMIKKLPKNKFEWEKNINKWNEEKIKNYDWENAEYGALFDVNLIYPKEIFEKTKDLPLAPESIYVETEFLSDYQKDLIEELKIKRTKNKKLSPNFYNKKNYCVHGSVLQIYLKLGLKIEKINNIITYYQDYIFKSYINYCVEQRRYYSQAETKNEFLKEYFKLLMNSLYGKTIENVRKHKELIFITEGEKLIKLNSQGKIKNIITFEDPNFIALEKRKKICQLNKPIAIGSKILDDSKGTMYNFWYNNIKIKYPNDKSKLIYMDTDSFIILINTDDIYKDVLKDKNTYDLSEMKQEYFFNNETKKYLYPENCKVLGKFKDESNGLIITEFIGLRSKMYAYKIHNSDKLTKRCKGVKKSVVEDEIKFKNYYDCLFSDKIEDKKQYNTMNLIRSGKFDLKTINQNKISLCKFDDKRYILSDGITSVPHGYY